MKRNNIFTFSFMDYMKKFGLIELALMIISMFLFAPLFVLFFLAFTIHFDWCRKQIVTLDPFQVERKFNLVDKGFIDYVSISEKREKYYYINEMTSYKKNYMVITIFGDIEYRKKNNINGIYEDNVSKVNVVKIYRTLKNEQEFIEALNKKIENKESR